MEYQEQETPLIFFRDLLEENECKAYLSNRKEIPAIPTLYALMGKTEANEMLFAQMYYINHWPSQSLFEIPMDEVCHLRLVTVFPLKHNPLKLNEQKKAVDFINLMQPLGTVAYSPNEKCFYFQHLYSHVGPSTIAPKCFLDVFEMYKASAALALAGLSEIENSKSSYAQFSDRMKEKFPEIRQAVLPFPGMGDTGQD